MIPVLYVAVRLSRLVAHHGGRGVGLFTRSANKSKYNAEDGERNVA